MGTEHMGQKTVKVLGEFFPIMLSFIRDADKNNLNRVRRLFREFTILFFALYFMLNYEFFNFLVLFALLLVAVYSIYEIGYLYNDFVRVKYDEKPTIRPYVDIIDAKLAAVVRAVYVAFVGVFVRTFLRSYIVAICILLIAILNHNLIKRKIDKIAARPFLRVSKYMFIPITMSNFNLEIISSCLLFLLPIIIMDAADVMFFAIKEYEEVKTLPGKPYYVWFLTFMPLQLLLLFKYSPLIFTGEFLFIAISMVRHK